MSLLALVVGTMLQAAPTAVATPMPSPTPSPTPTRRARMICRSDRAATGSLMVGPRICHTEAEWREMDRTNSRDARTVERAGHTF